MAMSEHDRSRSYFRHEFRFWLERRPQGTLGQLRDWLEEVHNQCLDFVWEGDPQIEGTDEIPCELDEYLNYWGDHDGECFSYREANIEEDIINVDGFIEDLGSETRLDSFPVFKVA